MGRRKKVAWIIDNKKDDTCMYRFFNANLSKEMVEKLLQAEEDEIWHDDDDENYRDYVKQFLEINRAPQFDQYEKQGEVPLEAMLADGWWLECRQCCSKVWEDVAETLEGEEYEPSPMLLDDGFFCGQQCRDEWLQGTTNSSSVSVQIVYRQTDGAASTPGGR